MSAPRAGMRRLALDVVLIAAAVLLLAAVGRPSAALSAVSATGAGPLGSGLAGPAAISDTTTLAAVIATWNSALTPPIYFTDLPMIQR